MHEAGARAEVDDPVRVRHDRLAGFDRLVEQTEHLLDLDHRHPGRRPGESTDLLGQAADQRRVVHRGAGHIPYATLSVGYTVTILAFVRGPMF